MLAARRTSTDRLEVLEVPRPEAADADEVIVDMLYAAVNPFDAQVLRGKIGPQGKVLTLGSEGTGLLDGELVQVSGGGVGAVRDGTFASQVAVPRTSIKPLATGIDPKAAATVGVAGKTAWRAVHQLAQVSATDVVLVLGASGGVGTFAAQLARSTGARVLAHTGSDAKSGRLQELGLEAVVAAGADALRAAVAGQDVSVVLDPLGGDYLSSILELLVPGARMVNYGVLAGAVARFDLGVFYGRGLKLIGTSGSTTPPADREAALTGATAAIASGQVVVDVEVLPLSAAPQAFERLAAREVQGKLLLDTSSAVE